MWRATRGHAETKTRRLGLAAIGCLIAALGFGGCAQSPQQISAASHGKEYFPSSVYGSASRRVIADGQPVPHGGGQYLVGKPYTVAGRTYYPNESRKTQVGAASWYGDAFHGRLTANGEIYDRDGFTAASPTMPIPSYVRVTNLRNSYSMIVRVNDRGPYASNRIMDVSRRVAEALDFKRTGTTTLKVEYVARASLAGSDDAKLFATLRTNGPASFQSEPTMVAEAPPRARVASIAPYAPETDPERTSSYRQAAPHVAIAPPRRLAGGAAPAVGDGGGRPRAATALARRELRAPAAEPPDGPRHHPGRGDPDPRPPRRGPLAPCAITRRLTRLRSQVVLGTARRVGEQVLWGDKAVVRPFLRGPRAALAIASMACAVTTSSWAEPLQTTVPHAILLDADTGTVLFERGADDLVTPASTAKIMTAELVFARLKAGTLKPSQVFRVSETAWRQGGAPSHGSTMFAKLNSEVSVDDLLRGLIVDSANDAAIVLAEGIAGSQGAFAVLMTRRARELGLTHLTFTDAWGDSNPDQKVTAREMALLAAHIIQTYPDLYKLFAQRDFLWNKIKQPNRNPLLAMDIGADGLKTGNIDTSGFAIVGSAIENGERLIVTIYGAQKASERSEEARKILQWGFRTFETRKVFSAGDIVGSADVYGGESRSVPLVTDKEIKVLVPRDGSERLSAQIAYTGPLLAPVEADKPVAALKLFRGTTEVLSVPLRTTQAVPVGSLPKRALDAGLGYFGDLFRKYVLRS